MESIGIFSWSNIQTILVGFIALMIVTYLTKDLRRNLPPGPWGLPVIGILPYLGKQPHEVLMKYAKKYGTIYSGKMGSQLVVFVNDYNSIRQMFVKSGDLFADRPAMPLFDYVTRGKGLVAGYLRFNLREKRRFSIKMMRSFGMGKSSFESVIVQEIEYIYTKLQLAAEENKPYNLTHLLENALSNITCGIMFGKRYEYDDPKFQRFLEMVYANLALASQAGALNFIPFFRFIPGSGWKQVIRTMSSLKEEFIIPDFEAHRQNLDVDNPRDFIDEFHKARLELEAAGESTDAFDDKSGIQMITEIFMAGSESSASVLKWALLYMVLYPEVQTKVHEELDSQIGHHPPTLKDQPNLTFCEAVIMEVTRIRPIAPLGMAHAPIEETEFAGYTIPKGVPIIANIWAVMYDTNTWKEPEKFRPERFIDDSGCLVNRKELIPFGIGRRSCIGEQLARMQLFLFFTHLMYHFEFSLPENRPRPSTYPDAGFTLTPQPYELILKERSH